jgi:hypothetical protein
MKALCCFPLLTMIAAITSTTMAQANPLPLIQRSDAIFQHWELVQGKFGCLPLSHSSIDHPGFSRYEMAAAVNVCSDRVNELIATSKDIPFISTDDLKLLEPLTTEFAVELATLRQRTAAVNRQNHPHLSNTGLRSIVVYTDSKQVTLPYEQFSYHGPQAEYIGLSDSGEVLPTPKKPAPRPISAWILPTLQELQNRYGSPQIKLQMSNPSDLRSSRYEVAAMINAFAEDYHDRSIKLRKIDADDFLNMQRELAEELVTLQERNREFQKKQNQANLRLLE